MNEFIINHMQNIEAYVHLWGFLIIFIFMTIESSFIPFPSEVVMIPAGFLAYRCTLTFQNPTIDMILVLTIGTAGAMTGALFNYYFSLLVGRPFLYRYGKYFFIKPQFLERSEEIFREYGDITTFVCRLLPAIRQLISIPAGLSRMPLTRFATFTLLGAGIWNAILAFTGYYLAHIAGDMSYAEIVHKGQEIVKSHFIWIILALVIIIGLYLYAHKKIMQSTRK